MIELLEKIKVNATFVKDEEFEKVFNDAWARMSKSFNKLEVHQYYDCDANDCYLNFIDNKYDLLLDELKEFYNNWASSVREKANVELNRLHLISYPLSKYIEYEFYFYLINEKSGEKINCLDIKETEYELKELDDFIIFDDNEIIINAFSDRGVHLGAYHLIDNDTLVKDLLDKFKLLFNKGKNYKEYYQFNKNVLKDLKNNDLI